MLSTVAFRFIRQPKRPAFTRRKLHSSNKTSATLPFFPAVTLAANDTKLSNSAEYKAARAKFSVPASKDSIDKTKKALEKHGHVVTVVPDKKTALSTLQQLIPDKSSINIVGSTTLVRAPL